MLPERWKQEHQRLVLLVDNVLSSERDPTRAVFIFCKHKRLRPSMVFKVFQITWAAIDRSTDFSSVRCFETTNVAWSKVNNVRYMAVQLDHANSNSVFLNSTPYHFPWIRPSVICYRLFRIPAISNYFTKKLNPFERARSNPRRLYILQT